MHWNNPLTTYKGYKLLCANIEGDVKILQRLEHPNIIWLHELIDDPTNDNLYIVTEFHSNGSLTDKVKSNNKFIMPSSTCV